LNLNWLRKAVRETPIGAWISLFHENKAISRWRAEGSPVPPPHAYKRNVVRQYARRFRLRTLVETGTYQGEMVREMKRYFRRIYSIELDEQFHMEARREFSRVPWITLLQGDSAQKLPEILDRIQMPALFWLDGHWSGGNTARGPKDTPIVEELAAILKHPVRGHVILVDDARCFTGKDDYPALEDVRTSILKQWPHSAIAVEDDVIRITPSSF
jgi:hypothetical protein